MAEADLTSWTWNLLEQKHRPLISYEDWLNDQMEMVLVHPSGFIFSIQPVKIEVKLEPPTQDGRPSPHVAIMDDNYYWKLFALLNKKYIVMIKLAVSYTFDRSPHKFTKWVDFSKFNEFLASKSYRKGYRVLLKKWTIKHPVASEVLLE
jgi:hypothetical protein